MADVKYRGSTDRAADLVLGGVFVLTGLALGASDVLGGLGWLATAAVVLLVVGAYVLVRLALDFAGSARKAARRREQRRGAARGSDPTRITRTTGGSHDG